MSKTRARALEGVTVLDLGQIYNGPYATFLMAMEGARVIKVESLTGETLRNRGRSSSAAYPFAMLNQAKESVTLNLKSAAGVGLFKRLVERADVVLENFGPDTMDRLGLGSAVLTRINPQLIYAAGSGYGRSGIHRDYLAMDITVQAMAGVMSSTGVSALPPMKAGPAIADFFGGIHLYGAVVTALLRREKTGKGAVLDVAMQDSVLPALATIFGAYYHHGREVPIRRGNLHPALTMAPYNVYETLDGHIAVICIREGHWRALVKAIGRPELLDDPRYDSMARRADSMEEVDAMVSEWTRVREKESALSVLQAAGVPSAVVRDVEELLGDPHLHARGMLRQTYHDVLGEISLPGSPVNVAFGQPDDPGPVPELGEHNRRVYGELLGLTDEEMQSLEEQGVI